jgi:HEAT repeat protein
MRIRLSPITGIRLSWAILLAAGGLIGGLCFRACPAATPAGPIGDGNTPAVRALESAGLKSDNASLLAYLAPKGDPPDCQTLAELVRQLGAEEWKTRDEATKKLIALGAAAREAMERASADTDPEVQARAKMILERLGAGPSQLSLVLAVITERKTAGAAAILLERMPYMGDTTREAARRALAACALPEDAPVLRNALKAGNRDAEFRSAVITVLFQISPEADAELLKACLADGSPAVRRAGVYAMYKATALDESFVPLLVNLLGQEDIDIAARAAGFLAQIGDPSAADALLGVLRKSNDYSFCYNVIEALVKMKGRAMAKPLIELLPETDARSRGTVLSALGRIDAPDAAEAVIGVLADPTIGVRNQACMLLANYADRKAVEPLCRIVTSDNDPGVRRAAAYALGRIGDARAVDCLVELITSDNYPQTPAGEAPRRFSGFLGMSPQEEEAVYKLEAREQAMTSLALIGGPKAGDALFQAARGPQKRLRGMAIRLLAETGDKRAVDLVIKGLDDGDYFIASGAVEACQFLDDPRILQPLIKLAASNRNAHVPMVSHFLGSGGSGGGHYSETYMRERALSLLKDRWPKEARPVLLGRLKDSETFVAGRAAEWLADANDRSAVPGLIDLLENGQGVYSKVAAGKALCRLKVKAALEPCLDLLQTAKDTSLAEAMGPLAQESFLDELEAELKKPGGGRCAALAVAAHVRGPQLADIVLPLADDNDSAVSTAAIAALGGLKNPDSVAPLLKRLQAAMDAPRPGPADRTRSAFDQSGRVRILAEALGNIGDKSAVEPLLAAMNKFQKDQYAAAAIAKALGQIGDARAFEPLKRLVRKCPRAAEGLAMLGGRRALPDLLLAANSASSDLIVAQAIFKVDPAAGVDALDKVLRTFRSNFNDPRVKAVQQLARIGNEQAIRSIRFALSDDGADVRLAARKALASLNVPIRAPSESPTTAPETGPATRP